MDLKNILLGSLLFLSVSGKGICQDLKLNFPVQAKALQNERSYLLLSLNDTIISLLGKSQYKGLETGKYNIGSSFERSNQINTDSTRCLLIADRIITYCRDLQLSPLISSYTSYDEISAKYATVEINDIAEHLIRIRSNSELLAFLAGLEPGDTNYKILLAELKTQIDSNNTRKIKALKLTISYYRWIHHFDLEKCIIVNIPSATLIYQENNNVALEMNVVVGKPSTKTPRFAAYCDQVILYPYWHVPRSIAVNEILPACKKSPAVPNVMNLQVLNSKGQVVNPLSINWKNYNINNFPYTFRQSTGCGNALGVIKFNITGPFSVYLHDTNFKGAFNSKKRFLSHGCIRVEKPVELANYILPLPIDEAFVRSCIQGQRPVIKNVSPVPVFIVYMPAVVDSSGNVIYYEDVYKLL